jgi:hypothetical protein
MHSQPPSPPRCTAAIGSSLVIALIVIVSDITIAAGMTRDVIAAVGQHLVILGGSTGRTRSAHVLDQQCPRCQDSPRVRSHRRRGSFPALKDNTAIRSGASERIIIY